MTAPIYGLTPAQADCARVIGALTDFDGRSPSYKELRDELCLASTGRVYVIVQALVERGWVKLPPYSLAPRALRLTRSPPSFNGNPIAITEAGREYLDKAA